MPQSLESVKALIENQIEASLGTLEGEIPFVSATTYLFEPEEGDRLGIFYLLLSNLARHTKNIQKNRVVSLLIVKARPEVPIQERARVTVVGEIECVDLREEKDILQRKYRDRFPWTEMLLTLPDFQFYRMRPREVHWIGGFAQVRIFKLAP